MISWLRSLATDREPEMTQQRWARVTELVDGASKRPGRWQRARYLAQACRGDRALRREVEDLLRYEDAESEILAGPLLPPPVPEVRPSSRPALVPGQAIGPYRVERILGGGGMGMVALAVDPELDLRVALKVIRRELVSAELVRRFHRERRLLARLEHPGIARILGGGEVDGLPWFAMEYVEGEPLDVYCDRNRLTIDERLNLVSKICAALEYAHRNLVVHQDLKPRNLLVTAEGEPKLLDFGIARQVGEQQESPAANLPTGGGRRLLTPACASPEQIRGLAITTATDIYSLGVLLYELLRVAAALSSLGRVLLARRRFSDAEQVLSEALSIRRELLGDDHPHVALSRKDLAALYFDLGESADAEVLWTQAVAVLTASKGPESWEIADAESLLGGHLAAQGRYQEAEACLDGSYQTLRRVRDEGAIYTRAARRRLDGLRRLELAASAERPR